MSTCNPPGVAAIMPQRPVTRRIRLHTGIFHSVDNANEIRDLILQRLRQFREAGLGDPEDQHRQTSTAASGAATTAATDALAAAREMLSEARALRRTVRS